MMNKSKQNLRIVFFGTPQFVVPVLQSLQENFDVVGVVTAPDQKVGRKQILTPSPVKLASQGKALQIFTPDKLDQSFRQTINHELPTIDLFVVAAYGKIIPQFVLDIPKFGALNIHPSLLPKYRGPSPLQETILNGDKTSAISIIKMDSQMDHGPVVFTKPFRLSNTDTFETLSKKIFSEAAVFLPQVIRDFIDGKLEEKVQDESQATYCKMINKESGYFDIDPSAGGPPAPEILDRMIRAYYPWPNVWTLWNKKIIKLLPPSSHPEFISGSITKMPKQVRHDKETILVQMEGKKPIPLKDFLNGHPDFPIKLLTKND